MKFTKKKTIFLKIIMWILFVLIVVSGYIGYRIITAKLIYSNMVDDKTLNQVSNELMKSGVPEKNVLCFKNQVKDTNKFLGNFHTFKEGFTTVNKDGLKYHDDEAFNKFAALKVPYMDINCRISAWNLMDGLITANQWNGNIEEEFAYEYSTLHNHPYVKMDDKSRGGFYSLYASIPSNGYHMDNKNCKLIKKAWNERGVKFKSNGNRTMLNVFAYRSDLKILQVQHAGVLIKRKNDYLFIEKWNPTLPFQASIFKSRKDVEKYLQYRMHTSFMFGITIMENGELFQADSQ